MINYVGYAVCEELQTVYTIESDYISRKSVIDNIPRVIQRETGLPYVHLNAHVFPAASADGERYLELAEEAARDAVTGCEGMETGYRFVSSPLVITQEIDEVARTINQLSKAFRVPAAKVRRLFDAYVNANEIMEELEALPHFSGFFERLQTVY